MSTSLVFAKDSQLFTSSEIVASGAQLQHKNVLELIRKYPEDFDTFGRVAFQTQPFATPGGTQKKEVALLNEQQAMLLFTYFRNTEIVRKFKIQLVKTFYEMRQSLLSRTLPSPTLSPAEQLKIRQAISARAKKSAVAYQTIYHALYARFQVAKYDQIKSADLQAALDFIATCEVKLPVLEDKPQFTRLDLERIRNFAYAWGHLYRPQLEAIYQTMVAMHSPMAPRFWEAINDMNIGLIEAKLSKMGVPVSEMPQMKALAVH